MSTLIVGASGATGRLLVTRLLDRGEPVKAIVRDPAKLPASLTGRQGLTVIPASIAKLEPAELARLVDGSGAVASCLGHNLSLRGIFGPPWRLVTDVTRRLCDAIRSHRPTSPVRFVLMNSAGVANRDLAEPLSLPQRCVLGMLRVGLPPHADNEQAADFLRVAIGRDDPQIEWVVVRPDTLIDAEGSTPIAVYPSPTRSALFDPGQTRRINVAGFMAELITSDELWRTWRGQMPVVYDQIPT